MEGVESTIAAKHIQISIQAKQIAMQQCKECYVYIATYTAGTAGQEYQQIEAQSGEEFWSLKAWTPAPHRHLKDPDLIITQDEEVAFLIEVKWGMIAGRFVSDLLIKPDEWEKMSRLVEAPALCRVRGPAVKKGQRYRSPSFPVQKDYFTNPLTKGVIVSDFHGVNQSFMHEFLRIWRQANSSFLLADIASSMGEIPSLKELLARGF
jgi:hypothetical protein